MRMKKLHTFSFQERLQAGLMKDILLQEGIPCVLRNERLSAAVGEIPFLECAPELWVTDDETFPRAKLLLDAWLQQGGQAEPAWQCPVCREWSEGHFGACWSCGTLRD